MGGVEKKKGGNDADISSTASSSNGSDQELSDRRHDKQPKISVKILESLIHPLFVISAQDYKILFANRAAKALNIKIRSTCYEMLHNATEPCGRDQGQCPVRIVKKTKKAVIVPHEYDDQNGVHHFVDVHSFPIFDKKEKVVQVIEYWIDTTDQREAETIANTFQERLVAKDKQLEATNKALRMEIAERKSSEKKIRKALQEKEVLMKELHHRVKNNMQVIASLLNLQSNEAAGTVAEEQIKSAHNRIMAMALVHEKLYQSPDLINIEFEPFILNMAKNLLNIYGKRQNIKLEMNINNTLLNVNAAITYGLIINELLTNSLRHAFPGDRKGVLSLQLTEDNGHLVLIVEDNGVGLSDDLYLNGETLGMKIVKLLTKQLNATLEINQEEGLKITIVSKK